MDISTINNKISELEKEEETALNCRTLASLYIIQDFYTRHANKSVEAEYKDILPQYRKYVEIKRKYQMDEITTTAVVKQLNAVCTEIKEFIFSLYYNSDFQHERELIENMINSIKIEFEENVRN